MAADEPKNPIPMKKEERNAVARFFMMLNMYSAT
jgi:hypothetical protein